MNAPPNPEPAPNPAHDAEGAPNHTIADPWRPIWRTGPGSKDVPEFLAGPRARDLLRKGTPIDLHPRVFGPGQCVQTAMVAANVILRQLDDAPSYELHVLNSFADYLWTWLEKASREYGVAVAAE